MTPPGVSNRFALNCPKDKWIRQGLSSKPLRLVIPGLVRRPLSPAEQLFSAFRCNSALTHRRCLEDSIRRKRQKWSRIGALVTLNPYAIRGKTTLTHCRVVKSSLRRGLLLLGAWNADWEDFGGPVYSVPRVDELQSTNCQRKAFLPSPEVE